MPAAILTTKLYIPQPPPKAVLRPRLIDRLNEGLQRRLVLVSAPAGFGKTTLVSEWIAGCGRPAAWLSLEAGDNDLARFLTYLIAALQTLPLGQAQGLSAQQPPAGEIGKQVLAALQSPQPPLAEAILTALLNEMAAIPDQFVLVLDDYHVIDARPVESALAFLIEHLPPQMHLVIATREDPPLPLARYRARGQLTELRAADLRFTPSEAAELLNQLMGLSLSADDITALEARTEGWIAGLQLAAISMRGNPDAAGFIHSFTGSHRFVLDYLIDEVLQHQPEPIRSFLLQTALLDRFCAPLCNAVTGREDGKEMLDALERSNLFLTPLDDQRQWYRYHHLFADVLQTYSSNAQPERVTNLHARASAWYERNGLQSDAIRHALAAQDFARAADLVELAFPAMNRSRQFATLLGWLKALPDELLRLRPVLSTEYALASMSCGENEAVEPRLRDAERWLNPAAEMRERPASPAAGMVVVDQVEFRRLPGMIAIVRGGQALGRGDMPETVKYAQQALDLALQDDFLIRGGAASQLGLAAWSDGDLDAARRMTAEGMENVHLGGYISPAIGGAIVLADIQVAQGCLHDAMATCERALQWATPPGAPVLRGAADMHVGISSLLYEHNDLQTAAQRLLTSQALGELAGLPQNPYRWCAAMARLCQARGDLDGALDLLGQAERLYDGNFSPNVRPLATRMVRVWLAQGRLGAALGWARKQGLSVENDLSYLREFDHLTLVRLLLARCQSDPAGGSISDVMGLLARLLKAATAGHRHGSVLEIRILQALASHAQGDLPAALMTLQHALALAEPEGYVRIFLDAGPGMLQLLREAAGRANLPGYAARLLAAFEAEPQNNAGPAAAQPLVEPLSQRELEVLRLLAQGLSNQEIGARLCLALDTVKGHNRRIFDKLQVQRRTEAVIRARELGLV